MSQLSSRLQESEREAADRVSDLEKKLIQTTKEVELLKVEYPLQLFTFYFLRGKLRHHVTYAAKSAQRAAFCALGVASQATYILYWWLLEIMQPKKGIPADTTQG